MLLLDCLIGLMLSLIILNPLLLNATKLLAKQMEYEKKQMLMADGERALELMGRAIRMAGYTHIHDVHRNVKTNKSNQPNQHPLISIEKNSGYRGSDSLQVKHGISEAGDMDCIGNMLTPDRTRHGLAFQGFHLDHPTGLPKGARVSGGALICQSLDRQGRLQNTTLMNGIHHLRIEELKPMAGSTSSPQKLYRIQLQMTDGQQIHLDVERSFSTRNLL